MIGGNSLLVLNFLLNVVDGVRRLDVEGDCLSRKGLNEDLHSSTETEDEVEGGLLLDVLLTKRVSKTITVRFASFQKQDFFDFLSLLLASLRSLATYVVRQGASVLELLAGED